MQNIIQQQTGLIPLSEQKLHLTIGWFAGITKLSNQELTYLIQILNPVFAKQSKIMIHSSHFSIVGNSLHVILAQDMIIDLLREELQQILAAVHVDFRWAPLHIKIARITAMPQEPPLLLKKPYYLNQICIMHFEPSNNVYVSDHSFSTIKNLDP